MENIILKIQPVTKTNYRSAPSKSSNSQVTGQRNQSAYRAVKHYRLAMLNVRYKKRFMTFVSDFVVLKTCHSNSKINLLSDYAIDPQSRG